MFEMIKNKDVAEYDVRNFAAWQDGIMESF